MEMKNKHTVFLLSLCFILFLFVPSVLFANDQRTYAVYTSEWQMTADLCRVAGVAGPSSAGPVTTRELLTALKRIDRFSLSETELVRYDDLVGNLLQPDKMIDAADFSASIVPEVAIEGYFHARDFSTYADNNLMELDWLIPYRARKPFLLGNVELWFGDSIYGNVGFFAKRTAKTSFLSPYATSNLTFDFGDGLQPIMPQKVGITFGNDFSNFSIARDRLSIGTGRTGNLHVGDNFNFQEYMKLDLFSNVFTYSLSLTHFDQQIGTTKLDKFCFSGSHQIRVVHRYALTFANRFTLGLNEGVMIQSDSAFDFRMLNPFMFLHNWDNYRGGIEEANNFFTLDFDYTFLPHWSVSGQIIIDQFQTRWELSGSDDDIEPNAWGALLNVSSSHMLGKGMLTTYLEGVYTSPFLYLLNDGSNLNRDLVVGYSISYYSDLSYTGYIHGPDSIVVALGGSYAVPARCSLSSQLLYKAHGSYGIEWYTGQTQTSATGIANLNLISPTGIVEHTFQWTVNGEFVIKKGIQVGCGLGVVHKKNYRNVSGDRWTDVQLALSATINLLDIWH
jgi:hypothetical protein